MKPLAIILFTVIFSHSANAIELLLGVAEQSRYENLHGKAIVRAMFSKSQGQWDILDSQDKFKNHVSLEQEWHLAFDGRYLGSLVTVDNLNSFNEAYGWTFTRDKLLKIKNISDFPLLDNKESRFVGWNGSPGYRPVVVVSHKNYKDIEKWKRFKPTKEKETLYPYVKENIPQAYHCNGKPKWDAKMIEIMKDDISLYRSYKNNKGEKLISIGIGQIHTKDCDGPIDATHKPMWFYIADNKVKFVGFELDLLDAGDYDADGKVEFFFWHGGYNNDGYTLYESDFEKRYDYYWSYH